MRVVNSRHTWTRGGWSLESGPRVIPGTNGGASGHHVPTSLTPWPARPPPLPFVNGRTTHPAAHCPDFFRRPIRTGQARACLYRGRWTGTCLESRVALASCSRTALQWGDCSKRFCATTRFTRSISDSAGFVTFAWTLSSSMPDGDGA